ncbi:hypothetical protein TNCV_4201751 [Trichonephila clavipes]|uniref:Uncharacterized protein n=1 Tax=Trichonephila clavipes TaxID=2585209 RepID=A0A8X6WBC9_TRICX|nr:hypothetical protein TNCV_4201751 [Trichonephila clavipes]
MPVVSDPCSCQPDYLVCGRGEVPPHDCAIHVLLESRYKTLKATLSNHEVPNSFAQPSSGCYGKIYFRLVALLGHVFTKRFDTLVIQGKDVLPVLMTQKLVTPDVVILNAVHEFCHQCGRDLRATNYLPSCTFSRSEVQDFVEKAVAPVPWMDFF